MTLGDRRDKPLPTITYLAPAAITNYISQTRRRGWKNWKNSPEFLCRKSVFSHSDPQMITRDFSQLWRRSTGECQRFSTFGLIFICHISSLCELGRKEKSIFLTYSEVAAPALGYCLCQCTFQFRLWTYNLSVWVILHKYDPRSYCYLHIPTFLCYSNFQFVIFKYFKLNLIIGDFWENLTLDFLPFTFEQIFPEKTFWIDSLINFLTKEIFRISKYFSALFEKNVSKCVFLKNGQTYKCSVNTVNRSQYLSPRKRM